MVTNDEVLKHVEQFGDTKLVEGLRLLSSQWKWLV